MDYGTERIDEDGRPTADHKASGSYQKDVDYARWNARDTREQYSFVARWAHIPEKEKWKYTIGIMLRQLAVGLAVWLLFFLLIMITI